MKKLHLIANAHIDPIWQWEWEEGASSALSTYQSACNLLEKNKYIFCHNEVTLYHYTERFAPQLYKEIQKQVQNGTWHVMGGWFLQPDCLMPCGEGIVRQIQVGKEFFLKEFGTFPTTAMNVDPFGHSRGMVQIMKKCGQDAYVFGRPWGPHGDHEQLKLPAETFIWQGYDGSTVKATRLNGYNTPLGDAVTKIKSEMEKRKDEEISIVFWGVGNHGGGPSQKDLNDIERLIKESDVEIVHSTPDKFFAEVNPTEVFDKSLVPCMVGCYTSMAQLKQKYCELERMLFFVEKLCSVASLKGVLEYPTEKLRLVTEDMLNVQFHDILPGDMIKAGEDNGFTYINHALHLLNQMRADAFFALCKGESVAEENTYPIFVFNPKSYEVEQTVEAELCIIPTEYYENEISHLQIFDQDGCLVASQTIKEASNLSIDWRKKVVFKAKLKPLSLNRFTAKTVVKPQAQYSFGKDIVFDNGVKHVEISAKTGLVSSYKVDGKEYANGDMFQLFSFEDYEDPWGMNYTTVGKDSKAFEHMSNPDGVFQGLQSMEIVEDGDVYMLVETFFQSGNTRVRIGYKLYKQGDAVDVEVNLFPCEINKAYKLCLPVSANKVIGEQIFGYEELFTDGTENVSQNFIGLKQCDGKYLEVLTPSTYGSSYKDGKLFVTLARMATYCAHPVPNRKLVRENTFLPKVDQGQRDFSFRLQVSTEEMLKYNADMLCEKPWAINVFPTIDKKTGIDFAISTSNSAISVVTIKKGERTDGYVIRCHNNSENNAQTVLTMGQASITANFGNFEVKTFVFDGKSIVESAEMLI